ncbi:MAG: PQQ-dependent sugar dehydrogenase [Phycisphaerae bacterium]
MNTPRLNITLTCILVGIIGLCPGCEVDSTDMGNDTNAPTTNDDNTGDANGDNNDTDAETTRPTLGLEVVATGLENPVFITHAPNDASRLFIVEKPGRIRMVQDGELQSDPFLDITDKTNASGSEQGLLGMAFHPDFPDTPHVFVYYTLTGSNDCRLSRFSVMDGNPNTLDAGSETELLTIEQFAGNHNGGWLGFSPLDGFLYVSVGDGGSRCDPQQAGQDESSLLGSMLRLDVDNGEPYTSPASNPLVTTDGRDEIWATGLRNAWRCAFDSVTGDLYIADVGQEAWEEVNVQPADDAGGANYGWDCKEGSSCPADSNCPVDPACECDDPNFVDPIFEYDHNGGRCSVTGGEVYRGSNIPELDGAYFVGDFCTGEVWLLAPNADDYDSSLLDLNIGVGELSSFGVDATGELYVCQYGSGTVSRIVEAE